MSQERDGPGGPSLFAFLGVWRPAAHDDAHLDARLLSETGFRSLTAWFDSQGAGTYRFGVTYINGLTDRVAHGDLYLLARSAIN